jgi:hypothetical protein
MGCKYEKRPAYTMISASWNSNLIPPECEHSREINS